ncbi:MAG: DUF4157 domain-containing protein [Oscillospiraceae bacterium]|nr:DUF4157 domain-containing protein [Oscillospiraceae bacterium]
MSKVYLDLAAEKEADDIGRKFMNSTDVVGDMSRAYGKDLSSVKIHTDSGAAEKASQRGVDAFSTGKDVFFARGAFDRSDPASRGLLAHELTHTMQQGAFGAGVGEVAQSAPMGAEQGGLIERFRAWRERRRERKEQERIAKEDMQMQKKLGRFHEKGDDASMKESVEGMSADMLQRYINGGSSEQFQKVQYVEIKKGYRQGCYNTREQAAALLAKAKIEAGEELSAEIWALAAEAQDGTFRNCLDNEADTRTTQPLAALETKEQLEEHIASGENQPLRASLNVRIGDKTVGCRSTRGYAVARLMSILPENERYGERMEALIRQMPGELSLLNALLEEKDMKLAARVNAMSKEELFAYVKNNQWGSKGSRFNGQRNVDKRNFEDAREVAIAKLLQIASPEELQDANIQDEIVTDFNTGMGKYMREKNQNDLPEVRSVWRGSKGIMGNMAAMLNKMVPQESEDKVVEEILENSPNEINENTVGAATEHFVSTVLSSNPAITTLLQKAGGSFEGVAAFESAQARSNQIMNFLVLSTLNKRFTDNSVRAALSGEKDKSQMYKQIAIAIQNYTNKIAPTVEGSFVGTLTEYFSRKSA